MFNFDSGDILVNAPILASIPSSNPKYECNVYKDIGKSEGEALLITLNLDKINKIEIEKAIKEAIIKEKFIIKYYDKLEKAKNWTGKVRIVIVPQKVNNHKSIEADKKSSDTTARADDI